MLRWSRNNHITSGCSPAPVHKELYEDHEDADQHPEPEEDEAPAEQGEAAGLPVLLLTLLSLSVLRARPISVSSNLLVRTQWCTSNHQTIISHLLATVIGILNSWGSAVE